MFNIEFIKTEITSFGTYFQMVPTSNWIISAAFNPITLRWQF